jgi:hypothetical protein
MSGILFDNLNMVGALPVACESNQAPMHTTRRTVVVSQDLCVSQVAHLKSMKAALAEQWFHW